MQLKLLTVRRRKGEGGRLSQALMRSFLSVIETMATSVTDHSWTWVPICKPSQGHGQTDITASDNVLISSLQSLLPWQRQNTFILLMALRGTRWVAGNSQQQGRQRIRAQTIRVVLSDAFSHLPQFNHRWSWAQSPDTTYSPRCSFSAFPSASGRSTWHQHYRECVRAVSSEVPRAPIKLKPSHQDWAWALAILLNSSLGQ